MIAVLHNTVQFIKSDKPDKSSLKHLPHLEKQYAVLQRDIRKIHVKEHGKLINSIIELQTRAKINRVDLKSMIFDRLIKARDFYGVEKHNIYFIVSANNNEYIINIRDAFIVSSNYVLGRQIKWEAKTPHLLLRNDILFCNLLACFVEILKEFMTDIYNRTEEIDNT